MASNKLYLDVFIQSSCGKQVKCSICDCWLPSSAEKFISSHVTGRKHNMELEKKRKRENKLQRSIYVKGFDPLLLDLENELQKYFEEMSVKIKDIYIDKNSSSYGIIEFTDKDAVATVLQYDRGLFFDKKLIIKSREIQKKNVVDIADEKQEEETVAINSLLPVELSEELKRKENIAEEMKLLMDFFVLTQEEKLLRNLICQLVENVLEELYPDCKVLQFGSSSNGLGEKGCDLDITLIAEGLKDEGKVCAEIREIIQRFAPGCKNVSIVQSTKTCSIVKFLHTESNLSVDLSINNYLALNNTDLLKAYMNFDERVPRVTFTIRKWAKCFDLSGRSSYQITQYSLTLLVIYFLQHIQPTLLPCLQECHPFEEVLIGQWNCGFCKCMKNEDFDNKLTVGELLHQFFMFYSSFDFDRNVIAIHSSSVLNRDKVYESVNALHLGDAEKILKFGSPLVVQDPFKLTHNVTHNLSEDGLKLFIDSVKQACSVWNEVGTDTISLMQLFVVKKKCFARQKQKRKRNRSNIYTISLPNCKHICDKSENECFVHVKTVLIEDLRMRISDFKVLSDVSEIKSSLESADIKEDETIATVGVSGGMKRTLTAVSEIASKKIKTESAASVTFIATAYADTWTNRRKQRRLIEKLKQDDNIEIENSPDINEDADSGITMSDISNRNVEVSELVKETESHALLRFNVSITKASGESEVCKLKLEPLDNSKNIQDFQTFYAYIKKELISVFK